MRERPNSYERMPFLKLYSREWLQGSLRIENDAAERGVWADFLALANESRNRGIIQANDITPYPHEYLASMLNIPVDLLEHCIAKFTEQGRVKENNAGIKVLNFSYWQGLDTKRKGPGRPSKNKEKREKSEQELKDIKRQNERSARTFNARRAFAKKHGRDPSSMEMTELVKQIDIDLAKEESNGPGDSKEES